MLGYFVNSVLMKNARGTFYVLVFLIFFSRLVI